MPYHIGIDAGSKTIKIVVCDESARIVASLYSRHGSNIKETLIDSLNRISFAYQDFQGTVGVTGSAGMGIAETLGIPFVQEVVATTSVVRKLYPDADVAIELGGEDAKIMYLSGNPEQRMNATCAGGTGGFLDTIAFMLGVSTKEMGRLALGATRSYPIASRCAVFAQTDVRPLLNAGVSLANIAGSALDAVVTQTLGGLACGRPIRGNVVFLGGPFEHLPALVMRFRSALRLTKSTGVKPREAHLFTALGAAVHGAQQQASIHVSLNELVGRLEKLPESLGDLPRLEPLFRSRSDEERFHARHDSPRMPRALLSLTRGPLFVGMDAGSTALKLAVLDSSGNLVYSDYQPAQGVVLETASEMLSRLLRKIPQAAFVARSCVTGYGERLLKAALRFDAGSVETVAHAKAAKLFAPDLSFMLDIGGQDMKALWFDAQGISNAVLNETCSSGCGSFIEGCAHSLKVSVWEFSELALEARHPVDLGSKCTVFMTSRVRHAQKVGASKADIAAGIAYSIVKNALQKVIGVANLNSLEEPIVVQGGAFKSDAVVRAFELLTGKEIVRPDVADIMGAIGCALIAKDGSTALDLAHPALNATGESALLSLQEIARLSPRTSSLTCPFCSNACSLSLVDFGNGERFVSGGRCSRSLSLGSQQTTPGNATEPSTTRPPNAVALQQGLMKRYRSRTATGRRSKVRIGVLPALLTYDAFPFWHTLFRELGFSLVAPAFDDADCAAQNFEAWESIPSESVCFPAKLAHFKLADVVKRQINVVFAPTFTRGRKCPVATGYARAIRQNSSFLAQEAIACVSPELSYDSPEKLAACERDIDALLCSINGALEHLGCDPLRTSELRECVTAALSEHMRYKDALQRGNRRAYRWTCEPNYKGAVLAARPYHTDPAVLHGIDQILQELGFSVILGSELEIESEIAAPSSSWKRSAPLQRLASLVEEHPSLELVCLHSFGCGYDAVNLQTVEAQLNRAGKTFTALKVGDIADVEHIRIRLRTLAEMSMLRANREKSSSQAEPQPSSGGDGSLRRGRADALDNTGNSSRNRLALHPHSKSHENSAPETQSAKRISSLSEADVALGRECNPGEVCFVATSLAGSIVAAYRDDPQCTSFVIPNVCTTCVCDAVPTLVENSGHPAPSITWEGVWGEQRVAEANRAQAADQRRTVGLVGCPLLVFEEACNEGIHSFIGRLGWNVKDPDPALMVTEDTRFFDQLHAYYESGVRDVLYLQSFGCLKGHVNARGALLELQQAFPDMRITVLDYSPETSKLNRESRILLALSEE